MSLRLLIFLSKENLGNSHNFLLYEVWLHYWTCFIEGLCTETPFRKVWPWLVWLSGLSAGLWTKGLRFDSQSGHMPGLWARSPVGGTWEAMTHWCFSPSLSPSLLLSLKINKICKEKKNLSFSINNPTVTVCKKGSSAPGQWLWSCRRSRTRDTQVICWLAFFPQRYTKLVVIK